MKKNLTSDNSEGRIFGEKSTNDFENIGGSIEERLESRDEDQNLDANSNAATNKNTITLEHKQETPGSSGAFPVGAFDISKD